MKKVAIVSPHLHLEEALRCSGHFPVVEFITIPSRQTNLDALTVIMDNDDLVTLCDTLQNVVAKFPKPLALAQLLSALQGALCRNEGVTFLAGFAFALDRREITNTNGRTAVSLTEKEALIIATLLAQQKNGISKEKLLQTVWGYNQEVLTNTLETHIYRLRQKLQKNNIHWQIIVEANFYKIHA